MAVNNPIESSLAPIHLSNLYPNHLNDGRNHIALLPEEMMLKIFGYLQIRHLGQIAQVCRQWLSMSEDDTLWKPFLERHFQKFAPVREAKKIYKEYCFRLFKGIYVTQRYQIRADNASNLVINSIVLHKRQFIVSNENNINILNSEINDCKQVLQGHTGEISCLLLTKAKKLISGSYDNTIKIWDLNRSECEKTLKGHNFFISSLLEIDGKLFSSSYDCTIKIWNLTTGNCEKTLEGDCKAIDQLFKRRDKLISVSKQGEVISWDLKNDQHQRISMTKRILCCLLTNKEKLVVDNRNKIKIWNLDSNTCEKTLVGHSGSIYCLLETKDEKIISGSYDQMIYVWNPENGQCEQKLIGHNNCITSLLEIEKGKLASASSDGIIKLWDLKTSHCEQTLGGHTGFTTHLLKTKKELISLGSVAIRVWNFVASHEEIWDQIASDFTKCQKEYSSGYFAAVYGQREIDSEAGLDRITLGRFSQMPEEERKGIYDALYQIIQSSLAQNRNIPGSGEQAFHNQNGYFSNPQQKAQAIRNYINNKNKVNYD